MFLIFIVTDVIMIDFHGYGWIGDARKRRLLPQSPNVKEVTQKQLSSQKESLGFGSAPPTMQVWCVLDNRMKAGERMMIASARGCVPLCPFIAANVCVGGWV